jgi:diguanylate cyclase (GGDEF)-like protein
MNDSTLCERNWRLDRADSGSSQPEEDASDSSVTGTKTESRASMSWKQQAQHWVWTQARCWMKRQSISDPENAVHDLARALQAARDTAQVVHALLQAASAITGVRPSGFQQNTPEESGLSAQGPRDLTLEFAGRRYGRVVFPKAATAGEPWPMPTLVRLHTVATLAALALVRLGARKSASTVLERSSSGAAVELSPPTVSLLTQEPEGTTPCSMLRDATFLHAVLPFAVNQARRHQEPISILCVAIDRLNGVRELLGHERSDTAVRSVGTFIARLLRASDIVARIDDDRIIAVLPHSKLADSLRIARNLCRAVEANSKLLPEIPNMTISIGVADLPGCADNVYALLDAADLALAEAKSQGRNRAIAAMPLPKSEGRVESCAG